MTQFEADAKKAIAEIQKGLKEVGASGGKDVQADEVRHGTATHAPINFDRAVQKS